MIQLYGIPNCDTVKKAQAWLDANGIAYAFHDYKKEGADPEKLAQWIAAKGVDTVLNRRGTTFRKLPEGDRARDPVELIVEHPSLIKRPVVEHSGGLLIGFVPAEWQAALG